MRLLNKAVITKTQSHISNTQKTRNNSQVEKVRRKIRQATATYQASWSAINRLAPNEEFGPWKKQLQELRQDDIRGPAREAFETSQSRHVPSWIWQTSLQTSVSADEQDLCAALRVEWCQAQERSARYEEEVGLVVEEMRRTLVFFEWSACEWEKRAAFQSENVDHTTNLGISAYAYKQAAMYRQLVVIFIRDWYNCLKQRSLGSSWLKQYPAPREAKRQRLTSNVQLYHYTLAPPPDLDTEADVGGAGGDVLECSDSV